MTSKQATAHAQLTDLTLGRSIPLMLESAVIILLLLLFSEALLGPLLADEYNPDSSVILRLMWLPIYGIVAILGCLRAPKMISLTVRMPMIIGIMLLIVASTIWSIDPELTLRRSIAIVMTTLFGLYLSARYNWQDMLVLFGITWAILAIGSFLIALGVPTLGIEQEGDHIGAWRGLWFQKNAMGGHMSRAALLFGFLAITQPTFRKLWIFGLILSVLLVLLSTSKTSLLGLIVGGGVLICGAWMRRGPVSALTLIWTGVTFGGLLVGLFMFQPVLVLEALGRDATLTGRTDIWAALFDVIADRPVLGYGYGAFWAEGSAPADYVREVTEWDVPTAHNGWLETWLSIGLLGTALFAVSFLVTLIRSLWVSINSWVGFFAIGFTLQFLLFSLSESIILQQNSITWLAYVSVAAALIRQSRRSPLSQGSIGGRQRDFILPDHRRVA